MTSNERSTYEALLRVRGFGAAHQARFPESTVAGEAFAQVAEAVARIEAHAMAKPVAASDGLAAKAAARKVLTQAMSAIAKTARGLAVSVRGGQNVLRMPTRKAEVEVLGRARLFIEQAEPVKDDLIRLGLPPTFLADLDAAADRFEDAISGRRSGRRGVAEAQKGVTTALALGGEALRQLDIVVPNVLHDQPELLAGWYRDRRRVVPQKTERQAPQPTAQPAAPEGGAEAAAVVPLPVAS